MYKYIFFGLFGPVLVAVFIHNYKYDIIRLIKCKYDIELQDESFMVIGILSARQNFEQRRAIRRTWAKWMIEDADLSPRVTYKFLVGAEDCDIPMVDRVDVNICERWKPQLLDLPNSQSIEAVTEEILSEEVVYNNYALKTIHFKVLHDVVLSKLGVHSGCLATTNVEAILYEASTQTEIVRRMFHSNKLNTNTAFRYKPVDSLILPKGFVGSITVQPTEGTSDDLAVTTQHIRTVRNDGGSIITFIDLFDVVDSSHYRSAYAAHAHHYDAASFVYDIHDRLTLEDHISAAPSRQNNHTEKMAVLDTRLQKEVKTHKDILVTPGVDVYKNLPHKVLEFCKWVSETVTFSYVLKTDDDCFLSIHRILNKLETYKGVTKLWWGRFRNNWYVERFGKWAELDFVPSVYPRFACGSGSVLSADLVKWLASNSEQLHEYQGEDASLGIWLSAVAPNYIDDPLWRCEDECLSDMYNLPQLNVQRMYQIYTANNTCGDPCGCT